MSYLNYDEPLIRSTCLKDSAVDELKIIEISSQKEFKEYEKANLDVIESRLKVETLIALENKTNSNLFSYIGYDCLDDEVVKFYSGFDHALIVNGIKTPNYREFSLSSSSWLNARMRGVINSIEYLEIKFGYEFKKDPIYLSEQITGFYKYFKKKFPYTIGSEYVSFDAKGGELYDKIRHEDIQNLSFKDRSFSLAISMEVLEHVPFHMDAFKSVYRVLKENGLFVFTVPFDKNISNHLVMAKMSDNGDIEHIKNPPEYHGDPMRPNEGALCYRYFGWETLNELKSVGFKDVGTLFMYSYYHGIIGNQDFIVVFARK